MGKTSPPTDIFGSDPGHEPRWLAALKEFHVLDATAEKPCDGITEPAPHICNVPITLICLKGNPQPVFKSKVVLGKNGAAACKSFCSQMISNRVPVIVRDARTDKRFAGCIQVTRPPKIRFYAAFRWWMPRALRLGRCASWTSARAGSPPRSGA